MDDMVSTCAPRSDQANYDDFIGGKTITIKITKVTLTSGDQPVSVSYEGDNGKPYKPCKGMRRVMVHIWGPDANKYIGQSMTLYGDPKVVFGGAAVGGIRISHMSGITEPVTMALTATRASRKPFTVKPLVVEKETGSFITRDQAGIITSSLKSAAIDSAKLFEHFGIKRLGELRADQMNEVEHWIVDQCANDAVCPNCGETNGHGIQCPDAEPPA